MTGPRPALTPEERAERRRRRNREYYRAHLDEMREYFRRYWHEVKKKRHPTVHGKEMRALVERAEARTAEYERKAQNGGQAGLPPGDGNAEGGGAEALLGGA